MRLVVGEPLARLSEATQRALVAAAVRGRVFELDLVERVAGDPGADLLDAFDEAQRARLITPARSESTSYTFTHELIRQTLLADASTVRRRRLHVAIADALEAIHAGDLEPHAADLAYHLAQGRAGGQDGRLVRYLRMAGDRAMDTAAYAEAGDHFAQAVALLERQAGAGGEGTEALAELVERLAMALRSQGRWDEALKVMDEALRLYEALGRTDALGRLCGVMSYQLGWAAKGDWRAVGADRGAGLRGVPAQDPGPPRADRRPRRPPDRARRAGHAPGRAARAPGGRVPGRGQPHPDRGGYRADLALVERLGGHVVEICERGGLPWLYVGHLYLGLAAHWRGDWETAERELRLANQLEAPGAIGGQSAAHLALHLARAGRGDEAAELFEARRAMLPVAGRTSSIGAWNSLLGFVEALALAGRHDEVAGLRPWSRRSWP